MTDLLEAFRKKKHKQIILIINTWDLKKETEYQMEREIYNVKWANWLFITAFSKWRVSFNL